MDLQCYNEVAALFMLLRFDLFIIYSKLSKNFAALGSLNKLIEGCGTSITVTIKHIASMFFDFSMSVLFKCY